MRKIVLVRSKALYALFKKMKVRAKELNLSEETIGEIVGEMEKTFTAIGFWWNGGDRWKVDDTTLPGADRMDCVCGPSRVAIRLVFSSSVRQRGPHCSWRKKLGGTAVGHGADCFFYYQLL